MKRVLGSLSFEPDFVREISLSLKKMVHSCGGDFSNGG